MDNDIYVQHSEHFPIPDGWRAMFVDSVEHQEAADQKTDHKGKLGVRQLHAVLCLWNLYQHQQECKYS